MYNRFDEVKMIVNATPWEPHEIEGGVIWVKREDLSCPAPGPGFSKIRGLSAYLESALNRLVPPDRFGVLDTIHSKAGWGVSYLCQSLGVPCTVFYPVLKAEGEGYVRPYQKICAQMGAELVPLQATRSAILWYRARSYFRDHYERGELLPNGLKLAMTIEKTAEEVRANTSPVLLTSDATWVVSVSSGTVAAGVARGLQSLGFAGQLILHLGYSRSIASVKSYIEQSAPDHVFSMQIIDEGYDYSEAVDLKDHVPFPCNPFYDRKTWKWLLGNRKDLRGPVVFWNIGV